MKRLTLVFFCISLSFRLALGLSPTYSACQLQKSNGESALAGCPKGSLYVSLTDRYANFSSVQEAINSLPQTGHAVILIGEGSYSEMINVTRSAPLTLLGQLDPATASIPAGNASQRNIVQIWNSQCVRNGVTDEETATLTVAPALYHPFGNVNFKAYNIDFENRGCDSISRALVTSFTLANASFYGCTFSSGHDTWYTGWGASTYAVDSIIYGQTDYLFGCGISWFQSVTLANRGCGGGITAWAGTPGATNGVYIADSRIIRSPDADASTVTTESCYLGRPWNSYAVAVFHRNYMDESIKPAGFTPWDAGTTMPNTTYYAEFESYGPGGNSATRIPQDYIMTSAQAQHFTIHNVFYGTPSWIDFKYKY